MKDMNRIMLAAMAWERAKGELNSIRHLFVSPDPETAFDKYCEAIDEFIKEMEDNAPGGFL